MNQRKILKIRGTPHAMAYPISSDFRPTRLNRYPGFVENESKRFEEKFKYGIDYAEYFFVRKNLSGTPNLDEIKTFMNKILTEEFFDNYKDRSHPIGKKYAQYLEMLYGEEVEFYYD